jgi:hypothetical protein
MDESSITTSLVAVHQEADHQVSILGGTPGGGECDNSQLVRVIGNVIQDRLDARNMLPDITPPESFSGSYTVLELLLVLVIRGLLALLVAEYQSLYDKE